MKPHIKFNNGNGAILCKQCSTIIKENLTKEEINGESDLFYCNTCKNLLELVIKIVNDLKQNF